MKFQPNRVAQATVICMACWGGGPVAALTQTGQIQQADIIAGERLSDWLLRNVGSSADTMALHWQVQAERAAQERLRQAVVQGLRQSRGRALSAEVRAHLSDWLLALPLTGRLTVAIADARWLQANPMQDPVLQAGQCIVLPLRPSTVTVVTETGNPCSAVHVPGALISDYLRACRVNGGEIAADWAWIAQADGRTKRYGIAPWNLESQDEPGAGAWIWAPSRSAGLPVTVSDNLARFLATQLPGESGLASKSDPTMTVQRAYRSIPRSARLSISDWGDVGLLQTPSARMAPAGAVRMHFSRVEPYTRGTVMMQPLDWLEAGFRYTDVSNRLYGPAIAGSQTLKDKSIDLKLRLHEETRLSPQLALGIRDLGGTGLFSGEYLVASKRWGNFDASLGLGWGYMGARGNIKNPLAFLGDSYNTRVKDTSTVTSNFGSMFHGPTALFGGVQWQSPIDALVLKLELDGNDYQHEPSANNQPAKSPINFGAAYTYSPNVDFSIALERGNQLMFGLTLHGALDQIYSPKMLDPVLPPIENNMAALAPPAGWGDTVKNIEIYTGWSVRAISHQSDSTTVQAETDGALYLQERIERAVRVLNHDEPPSSRRFIFSLQQRGLPMSAITVDRAQWVASHTQAQGPALRQPALQQSPGQLARGAPSKPDAQSSYRRGTLPGFTADWSPSYSQIVGGPDGFLLYQLGIQTQLEQRFSDNTWLTSNINLRAFDNYQGFKYDAPSDLPRVRTYAREYVTTSRVTMPLLQLTHVQELGNNQYLSVYGGMLESMFGGFGAEWLYRPWHSRVALGMDVNHVRQRDFRQDLAFRDYSVNTGHASLYWDTGWNDVQVKLSAGQYLAGDVGATLDVKRVFSNGVALGAWGTKTNVSAAQFGEGSFDKGIYVSIPFDAMLPKSSPSVANLVWDPLTRDGGARLNRRFNLFDLTQQRDPRALSWHASAPASRRGAEDTSYVLTEPAPSLFQSFTSAGGTLGHQVADIPASTWLWAGGAVLASSLLDKRVDDWAVNNQTPKWNRVGTLGSDLPVAMALGAGLLYCGVAGPETASTAETALVAGAYTMGAGLVTRYVVGRARPQDQLGSTHFDGFNNGAFQSSFTSNHVALAFALATPFAQKNDMPWLYGAAALTALGRIQSRDHWLSDTVGSAFMGYAIGTLVGRQSNDPKSVHISVTPQSVQANWAFN